MMMKPTDGATELQIFQVGVNQLTSNLHGYISICRGQKRKIKDDFKISPVRCSQNSACRD